MAIDETRLAENIRRAAGAHLVTLEALASYVGISRPAMMKLVARRLESRSRPTAGTALKVAAAFGVDVRALYDEPAKCLQAVVDAFDEAPVREIAEVPEGSVAPSTQYVLTSGNPNEDTGLDGSIADRGAVPINREEGGGRRRRGS